jgi:cellulose synthase/poly-beta-1,6-N-acetylglucosamine synthase-like glycosyltransferase
MSLPIFLLFLLKALAVISIIPAFYLGFTTLVAVIYWSLEHFRVFKLKPSLKGLDGTIAFVIPAHNESAVIERTIRSIQTCTDSDFSINVVADNCTDSTADIAKNLGANVYLRQDPINKSKGHALAWLIPQVISDHKSSKGSDPLAVVIVDADATISPDSILRARERFATGALILQSAYALEEGSNLKSRVMSIAFSAINIVRGYARLALGISDTFKGNGMWFRSSVLIHHPWRAFSLAEDLEFGMMLRQQGFKIEFFAESFMTGLPGESTQASDNQRSRWESGRLALVLKETPAAFKRFACKPTLNDFDLLMELVTPPLTYYVVLLSCLLGMGYWLGNGTVELVLTAIILLVVHFVSAIPLGMHPFRIVFSLLGLPFFFLWKIILLPRIWRDRKSKVWIRTDRN